VKALSVRQPHDNAILYYGTDIENENRSRCMNIRGTIALHASAQLDNNVYLPKNFRSQIVKSAIVGVLTL
jgi:hypothetical protein